MRYYKIFIITLLFRLTMWNFMSIFMDIPPTLMVQYYIIMITGTVLTAIITKEILFCTKNNMDIHDLI